MLDMSDKKMATIVVALVLLGTTTTALGATNVIVNGSGIVANTQPAIEAELIIGHSGSPANILVITQANQYLFRGTINSIIDTDGSTYVKFLVTDSITNSQYLANASKTGLDTWTLGGINQDVYVLNGHLQII